MPSEMLSRLLGHPALKQALALAAKKKHAALYDMTPTQRAFAALAMSRERPVVYVLPSERAARQAAEDLAQAGSPGVVFLPQKEIRFLRAVSSRVGDWQRLRALAHMRSGEARLAVVSAEALQSRMPPPEWFDAAVLTIKPGDTHSPQDLAARFAGMGYERADLVEGKGSFALRGDILDVYPPVADSPVRVEFFDVQVESVRAFDPLTQRSHTSLPQLTVTPASEQWLPAEAREEAALRLRQGMEKAEAGIGRRMAAAQTDTRFAAPDVELLLQNGDFEDAHMWAHLLYPGDRWLPDWLAGALLVLDTPDRALSHMEDNAEGYAQMLDGALQAGNAHPSQDMLLRDRAAVQARLHKTAYVTVQDLLLGMGGLAPDATLQASGTTPQGYHGRLPALAEDLRAWQGLGHRVFMFTGGQTRSDRLAAMLASHGLSASMQAEGGRNAAISILNGSVSEGFVFEGAGLVVLSPADLFGTARQHQRKARSGDQRIEAFTDLAVGDLVVHEHHGIGVYEGTVRLQSEGVWRDYLFIRYRGSDKLYVPTDQFDRVQKYIGSPDSPPELNDLSTNTWQKQKSRVKAGLKQLAFDLVKLYASRQATPGYAFEPMEAFEGQFADQFAYELTQDQQQAVGEVLSDMERPQNMDRLLCGDVGYGKTEVAMRAAFRAVVNGKQAAFLAPTTILVMQHTRTLLKRFEGFPVTIEFVSRFRSPRENKATLARAREGKVDILIGTHRLLSKDVTFKDLGLLVIDEEQRFGVRHKEQIKNLKNTVDVLTLSATPIPRTLHMSMVGVRDMSLLETPPEDRFPVVTYVVEYREALIRDAIVREVSREGQVFFLYNRVADIERMASRLRVLVPEARIAVAHGQMPEQALEDVMLDFFTGKHDVLLCSTIIENGLDIQNANTLIVYDADRFGLSQLYQLRGRVGRGSREAYAFFCVRADKQVSEVAEKRLSAIREFTAFGAGFRIAMRDLEIRGAGNIFGPEQSGQVAAVGYDMYVKMIGEAIKEAQGDFSSLRENELETRVDVRIDAFLPESYVQGETQRIEVYKRIAMVRTEGDERELIDELIDRFGEPGEPVVNLIAVARLRTLANALGCDLARHDNGVMVLRFHPQFAVDPVALYGALSGG
ncbi:MAG TPA: transcription-repair coupling factor, partial [Candidatus Limnocylindria bacterium]|nr:transcription-repair coupling factor [Candidatus Limnocylindria bacterium]